MWRTTANITNKNHAHNRPFEQNPTVHLSLIPQSWKVQLHQSLPHQRQHWDLLKNRWTCIGIRTWINNCSRVQHWNVIILSFPNFKLKLGYEWEIAFRTKTWPWLFIHTRISVKPCWSRGTLPDSKVYGANMGPILGRQDPGGPHAGPIIGTLLSRLLCGVDINGMCNTSQDSSCSVWYYECLVSVNFSRCFKDTSLTLRQNSNAGESTLTNMSEQFTWIPLEHYDNHYKTNTMNLLIFYCKSMRPTALLFDQYIKCEWLLWTQQSSSPGKDKMRKKMFIISQAVEEHQ